MSKTNDTRTIEVRTLESIYLRTVNDIILLTLLRLVLCCREEVRDLGPKTPLNLVDLGRETSKLERHRKEDISPVDLLMCLAFLYSRLHHTYSDRLHGGPLVARAKDRHPEHLL